MKKERHGLKVEEKNVKNGGWKKNEQAVEKQKKTETAPLPERVEVELEPINEENSLENFPPEIAPETEQEYSAPSRFVKPAVSELHDNDASFETEAYSDEVSSVRYFSSGSRRGRNPFAAKIGLAVLLLAVVGVVALVMVSIKAIKNSGNTSTFKNEIESFLYPVMIYAPEAFDSPSGQQQDALLLAAAWLVIDEEDARQQDLKTTQSIYPTDDLGRLVVPVTAMEKAYKKLFGDETTPFHHSLGEEESPFTMKYDKASGFYYIPALPVQTIYTPVVGAIKQEKKTISIEISFVLSSKIGVDINGKAVAASAEMADFKQIYTLEQRGRNASDGWKIVSIKDKDGKRTAVGLSTTEVSSTTLNETTAGETTETEPPSTTTSAP